MQKLSPLEETRSITFCLTKKMLQAINRLSTKNNISRSVFIREAVEKYLLTFTKK